MNSELYHIVIDNCDQVMVQGVKINAPGNSPNTDGIHVQGSTGVTITGASIRTGDDCVSIGPGTTNLWIELVSCGPGHGIRFLPLLMPFQFSIQGQRTKTPVRPPCHMICTLASCMIASCCG